MLFENSLYTNGSDGAEQFLKFRGFDIEKINVSEVFPELSSIKDMPGMEAKLKDAYEDMINGNKYADNKEFLVIPGAVHTDLYDGGSNNAIPFDKVQAFFEKYL